MKNRNKITAVLLSLIMVCTGCLAFAQDTEGSTSESARHAAAADANEYESGQVILVTEQGTSSSQMSRMAEEADGELSTVTTMGDGTKIGLVEVNEGSEQSAIVSLNSEDRVLIAQPNYKYDLDDYPNDPNYQNGKMDYLRADPLTDADNAGSINAAGAWEQLGNSELPNEKRILVGVIDTGVRLDHEDLQGAVVSEKCVTYNKGKKIGFTDGDSSDDDHGHGTSVTGIIAASINNDAGVCGVAGGRSKVFVVDARDADGNLSTIDLAMGIYYETDQGARLINMSLGSYCKDLVLQRAVKYAWDNDVLVVCSAGNKSTPFIHYPGDSPYSLCVMSHDWEGTPSSFTGYGINKDVSAPGEWLMTTSNLRKKSYKAFQGTSASCPVVTGAAALLLSEDPGLTPREIKNLLLTSSGKESFSAEKKGQGFGKINLDTAMKNLRSAKTVPEKIVINRTSIDIYEGQETYIEYAVYPGNTNSVNATFGSSNNNVVTVDKDGVIKAKAPGKATITVSCKGATVVCNVNVREIPYNTIDRKPYAVTGTFTMNELLEIFPETNADGELCYEKGYFYHLYHISLEKGETINAVMSGKDTDSVICIKDAEGNIAAKDDFNKSDSPSTVTFTADRTGTYQLLAIRNTGSGVMAEAEYDLKITSDRAYCAPAVSSTDYGQMRMTWPAVKDADCYRIRKYSDKELTKIESEIIVNEKRFVDTKYDSSKDQYYTVTACLQTINGLIFCGESPLMVKKNNPPGEKDSTAKKDTPSIAKDNAAKKNNPISVKGRVIKVKAKKLKKAKIILKRSRVMKISRAKGNVTYTKLKGNKKITINRKTGKVTIKKKLKKGTYKVKVRVKTAGNNTYKAASRTISFIIKVR